MRRRCEGRRKDFENMNNEKHLIEGRISQLIANGNGYCQINNLCNLTYCTEDVNGRPINRMILIFRHVSGVPDSIGYDIKSRKVTDIIAEIQDYTVLYMQRVTNQVIADLEDGIPSC